MEKSQTAVEWLIEQMSNDDVRTGIELLDLIAKAKQMEKKQIAEAYWNGSASIEEKTSILKMGEQYYNETYIENNDK